MRNHYKLFLFFVLLVISCTQKKQEQPVEVNYSDVKEPLIKHNRLEHEEEMLLIKAYMKRHNWKPITTGTGINYMIYQKADTSLPKAKLGQVVTLNYSIKMLNDSLVYASDGEPANFMVGYDDVESGLHEAITYLRKGDKALIILPSNLAFGLTGDNNLIPSGASLIYDIEVLNITDKK